MYGAVVTFSGVSCFLRLADLFCTALAVVIMMLGTESIRNMAQRNHQQTLLAQKTKINKYSAQQPLWTIP